MIIGRHGDVNRFWVAEVDAHVHDQRSDKVAKTRQKHQNPEYTSGKKIRSLSRHKCLPCSLP